MNKFAVGENMLKLFATTLLTFLALISSSLAQAAEDQNINFQQNSFSKTMTARFITRVACFEAAYIAASEVSNCVDGTIASNAAYYAGSIAACKDASKNKGGYNPVFRAFREITRLAAVNVNTKAYKSAYDIAYAASLKAAREVARALKAQGASPTEIGRATYEAAKSAVFDPHNQAEPYFEESFQAALVRISDESNNPFSSLTALLIFQSTNFFRIECYYPWNQNPAVIQPYLYWFERYSELFSINRAMTFVSGNRNENTLSPVFDLPHDVINVIVLIFAALPAQYHNLNNVGGNCG
jgi:hypothetical protein